MAIPAPATILIADDDPKLRFIIGAHLRAAGFAVIEAGDGVRAVELVKEKLPSVVVMDLTMPRMDGLEATRKLKADAKTAAIPVIIVTGKTRGDSLVPVLDAGAQDYIPKPFDIAEFLARVRTVYRLAAARQEVELLNNKLEKEVRVHSRRLQLLYEFMRDLNRARDRNTILDRLMSCVCAILQARRVSLLLTDESGNELVCVRSVGIDPQIAKNIRMSIAEGISGRIFQTGQTLEARVVGHSSRGYESQKFISTPLISGGASTEKRILGVLNITDREGDESFSQEEIECIQSVADATGIALDGLRQREQLEHSIRALLETVGLLAEYRDEETTQHLRRVAKYARLLAVEARKEPIFSKTITDEFIAHLVQAAPMHDIGKVGIPDEILTKPGSLTDEEFRIMKTHTDIGRRVLSKAFRSAYPVPLLRMCIEIAYSHHERYDGKGYPQGLAGEDIPLSARIMALVDAYDAMTSQRRYKAAKSHEQTTQIILSEAGKHFDPVLVEVFKRCADRFGEIREKLADDANQPTKAQMALASTET